MQTTRTAGAAVAAVAALLSTAASAHASDITVTSLASGTGTCPSPSSCTLTTALTQAGQVAGADTITIQPVGSITLGSELVPPTGGVTIIGQGAENTTFVANASTRAVEVNAGVTLAMQDVTLKGGSPMSDTGGTMRVNTGGSVQLFRVRLTGGTGSSGGGNLYASGATSVVIRQSEIDGGSAASPGGGISWQGGTGTSLAISDSTITNNSSNGVGGISVTPSGTAQVSLSRVTIAGNHANSGVGSTVTGGLSGAAHVDGSIIADNTAGGANTPSNCTTGSLPVDGGHNLESGADCGFTTGLQHIEPQLGALTVDGQTRVLPITALSPAFDAGGACTGVDQRGLERPQATACDIGAYEVKAPDTSISGGPQVFTLTSDTAGATFQCSLDGTAFTRCASPFDVGALTPGTHSLAARAMDTSGVLDGSPASVTFVVAAPPVPTPTPAPTAVPTPTPTPTPTFDKTVVIKPVKGKVLVRRPGSSTFVAVDGTSGIPDGSTVDTRKGTITLTSQPKSGKPQTAMFFDGLFKVTQTKTTTDLTLTEALAPCPKSGQASAAASKPKTRKLWGNGSGAFRTRGKYSAATVRGTEWLVQDSCAGTTTTVKRGVVSVRDEVRNRTIIVRAGKHYLAKPHR